MYTSETLFKLSDPLAGYVQQGNAHFMPPSRYLPHSTSRLQILLEGSSAMYHFSYKLKTDHERDHTLWEQNILELGPRVFDPVLTGFRCTPTHLHFGDALGTHSTLSQERRSYGRGEDLNSEAPLRVPKPLDTKQLLLYYLLHHLLKIHQK